MGAPIAGYVGANGGGKTLGAMLFEVLPALNRGMPVISTVKIDHPLCTVLEGWRDVMPLHDCLLLLDDISAQLPSRGSSGMPPQLLIKLNTLRHDGVRVVWTAPHWRRADIGLREVTQEITVCRGLIPDRFERSPELPKFRLNGKKIGRVDGLWRPNRLFRFQTYDATSFDEFTEHKRTQMKPLRKSWYWRPWHTEQYMYETTAPVLIMDHVDQGGWCLACGGKQVAKKCGCDPGDSMGFDERASAPSRAPSDLGFLDGFVDLVNGAR